NCISKPSLGQKRAGTRFRVNRRVRDTNCLAWIASGHHTYVIRLVISLVLPRKFQHYFGHATPEEVEEMVAAATWERREYGDDGDSEDLASIERVVRHVATTGLSYAGLSVDDAGILDGSLGLLFSPEGLEKQLGVGHESPDDLHPMIIEELLRRATTGMELRY